MTSSTPAPKLVADGLEAQLRKVYDKAVWTVVRRQDIHEGHLIDEALKQGVRDAMLRHKAAGLPVVIYRDGRTVWIMPHDLGY